jgi:hypothetical protein
MSPVLESREQLQHATTLPALLEAAYGAFEQMLVVIRARENPASGLFAAFVMSAASAADGRDAVAFAPSFPSGPGAQVPGYSDAEAAEGDDETVAESVAALSRLLAVRLTQAGPSALDLGDRAACADAARCAETIYGLLHRSGP